MVRHCLIATLKILMPVTRAVPVLLCGVLATWPAVASAGELFLDKGFEVDRTEDVVYGSAPVRSPEPGSKDLLLDIYQPVGNSAPELRPALLVVHGGGFILGDKADEEASALCRDFTARGYVCASIDYRLQSDDPPTRGRDLQARAFNAAIRDARTALRWLHDNAARYRVDRTRVAVGGVSAGATTVLSLAYRFGGEKYPIAAVFVRAGRLQNIEAIQAGDPPVIMVKGTEDEFVPIDMAKDIIRRAGEVGVVCRPLLLDGFGHGVPLSTEVDGVTLYDHIARFFYEHLDLEGLTKGP